VEIAALAAVHVFLTRLLDDRERGRRQALEDYQRQFPGFEREIEQAWNELSAQPWSGDGTKRELVGRFQLVRLLGRGGQGTVHLARDPVLKREVALKLLDLPFGRGEDARHRFRREAEAASRVSHPGICAVHEVGEHEGRPYIVMQYIDGENLAVRIARERGCSSGSGAEQRARVEWAIGLVERVGRAAHAAHEAGVVHRDLKPGNIALLASGEPVVLDFGLARDDAEDSGSLTRTGDSFGTPAYMAPEQIQSDGRPMDRRTDVYALGVLLYECLALRRPFEAPTRTSLVRLMS